MISTRRRYACSGPFTKTNHIFGDIVGVGSTTYRGDYSGWSYDSPACPPCCTPEHGRLRTISPDTWLNDTTPRLPPLDRAKNHIQSERKKQLQKTNFCFGNDPAERTTAYAEFAAYRRAESGRVQRRPPCSPPKESEVFPQPALCQKTPLSTVASDFSYLGPDVADRAHQQRVEDLWLIKSTHDKDSVGSTILQQGRRGGRVVSRSMVDYCPPRDRREPGMVNVRTPPTISPFVRHDSIWQSVTGGGPRRISSEMRQNFSCPLSVRTTKRFCRGHMNKVR